MSHLLTGHTIYQQIKCFMMIIKNIYDSCLFKMMVILCKMHFIIKSLAFEIHFYSFFPFNFFCSQMHCITILLPVNMKIHFFIHKGRL